MECPSDPVNYVGTHGTLCEGTVPVRRYLTVYNGETNCPKAHILQPYSKCARDGRMQSFVIESS